MGKTILLLLIIPSLAAASFEQSGAGARAKGLGGAYAAVANDLWTVFYNPAGLVHLKHFQAGIFYSPQPFGIAELAFGTAAIALPTSVGNVGVSFQRYGFDLYREVTGTLSYANRLFDVGLGTNIHYHSLFIQNYGSAATMAIDIGATVVMMHDIVWGIAFKNVTASAIGRSQEKLPQLFMLGLSYRPTENVTLALDYEKETKFDAALHFGTEYQIVDFVAARLGFSENPSQYAGGIGLHYEQLKFDYAFTTHGELGLSHQLSIQISWGGE
jgi:long-subunit fatty acid transport protein